MLVIGVSLLINVVQAYEIFLLDTRRNERRLLISLTAYIDVPIEEVHKRLTNFDALMRLSPSIEESRRLKPDEAGDIIVYTRMRPCVLFVCKTVRIFELITYPERNEIVATVIAARSDLAYGLTHWQLHPQDGGTLLQYDAEFEPGFDMFPLLGPAAARYSLRKQAKAFLRGLEQAN